MSQEAAPKDPKIIVSDSDYSRPVLLRLQRFRGKWAKSLGKQSKFTALLVGVVILIVISLIIYKRATNHNITIGKTVITSQARKELSDEIAVYSKLTHVNFGGSPQHVADDDLILNAALKDQADKHDISITQADIDVANAQQYRTYGSKAMFERHVQAVGISNLTNILGENNAYEAKLNNVIIAKKNLFIVAIEYNSPYFGSSSNPAVLRQQATSIMQNKFLPLFKQHKTETQIAAQTTLNYTLNSPSVNESATNLFFTGMPSIAFNVLNCSTAKPCFNDAPTSQLTSMPGTMPSSAVVAGLTRVGQYTNVFTSRAGFIGIIQLSSQTPGAYNSWDQLLQDYRKQYAPKLAFINTSNNWSDVTRGTA